MLPLPSALWGKRRWHATFARTAAPAARPMHNRVQQNEQSLKKINPQASNSCLFDASSGK
ncbi:hypothetical protein HH212_17990 [Massilia forsythiae]|uniref:Uncharacterized protein n=1 Tax=Massilia forsythiae TaxID=2728020 RepID=A0A7Z2VZF0_9BURK|nr:hypothetical protein [Massilia forsythiae]QJE01685.1 hypothetical protein HH212_17990 [Massilia forsythiae]